MTEDNNSSTNDETFAIELIAMAHGGSALGRHEKKTIFIPYTIPGEIVEARIREDKGRIAFADGVKIIDVSADREYPRCPHFGPQKCGRCQWQHINYGAQLLLKQDVLADQLARVGKFDDTKIESVLQKVIPAVQMWGYNYHMTLAASPDGEIGFPRSNADGLTIIDECHIMQPDLLDLLHKFDLEFDGLERVRLQMGTDGNHMIVAYINDEENTPQLHADMPTSVNVILPDNEPVNLIGDTSVMVRVGEREFRVTAGVDFRPNVSMLPTVAEYVLNALAIGKNSDKNILDLYGGAGFFSAFVGTRAALITLVESYPPAATNADENLTDFDHIDVIEGTVEDVLPELEDTYHAAIIDPPSSGLSVEAVDALGDAHLPRLVYVSGDPATLARDAQRLSKKGYTLQNVQPIDLAPQTYYIDSIAVFVQTE